MCVIQGCTHKRKEADELLGSDLAQPGKQRREDLCKKVVADVDCMREAVFFPCRGTAAAKFVAIFDIIMNEAEIMHELDGGRKWQGRPCFARQRMTNEQAKQRAQAFAMVTG